MCISVCNFAQSSVINDTRMNYKCTQQNTPKPAWIWGKPRNR